MPPRRTIGDEPMSPAERVRRARWANRVEDLALKLLDLLEGAPEDLTRRPEVPVELVEKLEPFLLKRSEKKEPLSDVQVLKPGNGNQARNKAVALEFCAKHFDAEVLDHRTIQTLRWGRCHVSAYTAPLGAMISSPRSPSFGSRDWHQRDHIILFRDVGDGRCMIYISKIEPLFGLRTIGHHGVRWEDVEKIAEHHTVVQSQQVMTVLKSRD